MRGDRLQVRPEAARAPAVPVVVEASVVEVVEAVEASVVVPVDPLLVTVEDRPEGEGPRKGGREGAAAISKSWSRRS